MTPNNSSEEAASCSTLLAWLRLSRITLLPSAMANILMAFLVAGGSWEKADLLLLLVFSSSCLYPAGMILNDYFDRDIDAEQRPERPLPSGVISVAAARNAGFGLLAAGVAFAAVAGYRDLNQQSLVGFAGPFDLDQRNFQPLLVALLLAAAIVLYNGVLKKTLFACPFMGACRGLNVLLGASTCVAASSTKIEYLFGFPVFVWWIAASIFVLVSGVTWFARNESEQSGMLPLLFPAIAIGLGLVAYALIPRIGSNEFSARFESAFPWLILLLSITIVRRTFTALASGAPRDVQQAVVAVLRSLIILDAAICLLVPGAIPYATGVLCLLIPSLILSRRIRST